jgi:hypothetical protein
MVAKTFDINAPAVAKERAEPRSDMFAQSSALYSRINKKSKTSPWMIIAPAAIVVIVGGAIIASGGSHKTPAPAVHTTSSCRFNAGTGAHNPASDGDARSSASSCSAEHGGSCRAGSTTGRARDHCARYQYCAGCARADFDAASLGCLGQQRDWPPLCGRPFSLSAPYARAPKRHVVNRASGPRRCHND